MDKVRQLMKNLLAALGAVPRNRLRTAVIALLLTVWTVCIPSSRIPPTKESGERFGEVHWYQKEASP